MKTELKPIKWYVGQAERGILHGSSMRIAFLLSPRFSFSRRLSISDDTSRAVTDHPRSSMFSVIAPVPLRIETTERSLRRIKTCCDFIQIALKRWFRSCPKTEFQLGRILGHTPVHLHVCAITSEETESSALSVCILLRQDLAEPHGSRSAHQPPRLLSAGSGPMK